MRFSLKKFIAAVCLAFSPALLSGCASSGHQATMKMAAYNNWNLARIQIIWQLAHQQYETLEYKKCRKTLKQAFAAHYAYEPLYVLAARVDIETGRLAAACNRLKTASQINAADPEPYYLLGIIYQRWQNNQAAHDYYRLAWQRKPSSPLYMLAMVEMKIAMGQYASAQKLLKSKLMYFEESAAVRAALARLCMIRENYARACHYYRAAILLSPNDVNLKLDLAEAYYFNKSYHKAQRRLVRLRAAHALAGQSTVLLLLGECYLNLNRPIDAHDCFADLSAKYPHDAMVWTGLAKSALQINDLIEARIALRKALRVSPRDVHAWMLLALVQQRAHHWQKAMASLLKAHAIAPGNSTVLCMLGISARQHGQQAAARAYFQRAVKANPKDHWARKLLGETKG